ncbi:MAG: alpha/beta hydrolase [Deltaproteobacteria bacterium]|nr:alpha/beta hydrolase [Deltaproteobacteria bacterium]
MTSENVRRLKTKPMGSKLSQLAHTQEGFVRSFDGTQIWYRSVGEGLPIVCCNGLGCSTFYFGYLENYFKRNFRVITWDYRGHGKSGKAMLKKNHTIGALKCDLKAVLDKLEVKKAIFVGHSMGVQLLYEFHSEHSRYFAGLISCFGTFEKPMDTFFDSPLSKYVFEVIYIFNHLFPRAANMIGAFLVKNPLWFEMGGLFKLLKPYMADRAIMKQYVDHIIHVDPIFLTNLIRSLQTHTAESTLKKIKAPALIMGAAEDTFTPIWISKKMHHLIPGSELFIVKKGSHVALCEQPELINFRIEKFINERIARPRRQRFKEAV